MPAKFDIILTILSVSVCLSVYLPMLVLCLNKRTYRHSFFFQRSGMVPYHSNFWAPLPLQNSNEALNARWRTNSVDPLQISPTNAYELYCNRRTPETIILVIVLVIVTKISLQPGSPSLYNILTTPAKFNSLFFL